MLTRLGIAVCVLSISVPVIATAQTAPQPVPSPVDPRGLYHDQLQSTPGIRRVESERFNRDLTANASVSPARAGRAERVAVLINEGRCDDAVALARSENDRRLARRAAVVCESLANSTSAPQ